MDRKSWTQQEDQAIISLVDQFGVMDWTNISQKLKHRYNINQRTGKQCRERWYNHLNPEVNKKPWSEQQQKLLFEIHRKSGNKWKLISRYFAGRTDNDIKNHFYSTLRRSLRRLNKFIGEKNSTTQMREIKPSVLSTIMNYIYQQQNNIETNIVNSLKDLPYLVFEFSNYKPVKGKVKIQEDEVIKDKINFIFLLINKANATYQILKQNTKSAKAKRTKPNINTNTNNEQPKVVSQNYQNQHTNNHQYQNQHTHHDCKSSTDIMLTSNNTYYNINSNQRSSNIFSSHPIPINAASIQLAQQLDFFKYLPKKSYSVHNSITSSPELSPLNHTLKKSKQKTAKILKNNPPVTLQQVKIQQQDQEDYCSNSKDNKCYDSNDNKCYDSKDSKCYDSKDSKCYDSKDNKCYDRQQLHCSYNAYQGTKKSEDNHQYSIVERLERELSTDLMCEQFGEYTNSYNSNNNTPIINTSSYDNRSMLNNTSISNRDNNSNKNGILQDGLKQRRISLQAYEDFVQEDIGQVQQPSEVSGFYCERNNSFQDLVVVGKQVTLHQSVDPKQAKRQQRQEDNSDIDELIEINYSH